MNLNDAFPSKYLKASDLPEGMVVPATIDDVTMEELGQGKDKQNKLVISFVGKEKTFVCNKTNARMIAKLHGDETDSWSGKPIGLFRTEVQFGADLVESIRVASKIPKATTPAHTPEPELEHNPTDEDSDCPF